MLSNPFSPTHRGANRADEKPEGETNKAYELHQVCQAFSKAVFLKCIVFNLKDPFDSRVFGYIHFSSINKVFKVPTHARQPSQSTLYSHQNADSQHKHRRSEG